MPLFEDFHCPSQFPAVYFVPHFDMPSSLEIPAAIQNQSLLFYSYNGFLLSPSLIYHMQNENDSCLSIIFIRQIQFVFDSYRY